MTHKEQVSSDERQLNFHAKWSTAPDEVFISVTCEEPRAAFRGDVVHKLGGNFFLITTHFSVQSEQDRNRGVGTQLMMATLALAKLRGITHTVAALDSPASLRIRQKLFGEKIVIADGGYDDPALPITVDNAIASLDRQQQRALERQQNGQPQPPDFEPHLAVISKLCDVDTMQWQLPTEVNALPDLSLLPEEDYDSYPPGSW
jgi:hypothetical protein